MKSPFIIKQDFISPLECEKIISNPRDLRSVENALSQLSPEIMSHYLANIREICVPEYERHFENPKNFVKQPGCENSNFLRKRWVMTKDIDLVGYIWLKEFNDNVPLDTSFEVYGGKLEFPAYGFSLKPQVGTLVLYPAGPHFITAVSPVLLGELNQIKVTIKLSEHDGSPWFFNPIKMESAKWQDWFEGHF